MALAGAAAIGGGLQIPRLFYAHIRSVTFSQAKYDRNACCISCGLDLLTASDLNKLR
jgi:hypothetical protein